MHSYLHAFNLYMCAFFMYVYNADLQRTRRRNGDENEDKEENSLVVVEKKTVKLCIFDTYQVTSNCLSSLLSYNSFNCSSSM